MTLRIELLGGFRLIVDGAEQPAPIRKAQLLIARTALAPRMSVGRGQLCAMLWETSDEAQARASLRQALAHARRALGAAAGALRSDGDRIGLDPAAAVDVAEFEAAVDAPDPRSGLALLGGELLEGLAPREAAVEEWLGVERSRLRHREIELCARAAEAAMAAGDAAGALTAAMRGLAADPLREGLHRVAMRALSARGDAAAALRQFRVCRDVLERELGARPEPETIRLYDQIRTARAASPAPTPHPREADPAAQAEIRAAVVLCAAPAAEDDPESFDAALRRIKAVAAAAAAPEGGLEIATDAPEVVLAFGLRNAREDEAVRAGRAAAAILAASPGARIGCASGRVIFNAGPPPSVSGETRGRAAALMATARPGAVELGAEMRDTARPEPVFVGRALELAQLRSLMQGVAAGTGAAAVVAGEPGIGKTRLTSAFALEVEALGGACIRVGFEAFGRKTRAAAEIVASAARLGAQPPRSTRGALRAMAAQMLGLAADPADAALLAALSPDRHAALNLEVVRVYLDATSRRPLLVLVEDAHWAEPAEVELFLGVADAVGAIGALFVATERSAEAQLLPALRRRISAVPMVTIELGPFTSTDGARLAVALGVEDPARLAAALTRTGGNPLFLARLLSDAGDGRSRLPESVVSLVQEQLDRLDPGLKPVLRQAAILGQSFSPEDYALTFGPAEFGGLVAAGFLARDRDRLAFQHALVHEAVYASMPRADRRRRHERAAAVFRTRDPERWADHALAADSLDAATACVVAADLLLPRHEFAPAARYIAAGLAAAREPSERAALLISRGSMNREMGALDLALADYAAAAEPTSPANLRAQALVRLAWVHRLRGDLDAADGALAEALRQEMKEVTPDIRAEIEHQLGMQAFVRGDATGCLRHTERALALAQSPLQRSRALGGIGDAHYAAGRMVSARRAYGACIELARESGLGVVDLAHAPLEADCVHFTEPGPGALAKAELAVERCREAGNPRDQIVALHSLAEILMEAQEIEPARAVIEEAGRLVGQINAVRFRPLQIWFEATLRIADKAPHTAETVITAYFSSPEGATADVTCANLFGLMACLAPDPTERREAIAKGMARIARESNGHSHLWFYWLSIEALLSAGCWSDAEAQVRRLECYVAAEPLIWVEHAVCRARLIAKAGQGLAGAQDRDAARALVAKLDRALLRALLPGLRSAFDL